jgi:hypothetical protein
MSRPPSNPEQLRPWMNEPIVMNAILACMRASYRPLLGREIRQEIREPGPHCDRALRRLTKRGLLNRHRIPCSVARPQSNGGPPIAGGGTKMLWLYSLVESDA